MKSLYGTLFGRLCCAQWIYLFLYFSSPCMATPLAEYRCAHYATNTSHPIPFSVVLNTPTRRHGAWATYTLSTPNAYAPIRIRVSTKDLYDGEKFCGTDRTQTRLSLERSEPHACTDANALTEAKRETLLGRVIPNAVQLHAERLSVLPVSGRLRMPATFPAGVCTHVTVPPWHRQVGLLDTDFVLYVSAAPGATLAAVCSQDAGTGRPTSGVWNINPTWITDTRHCIRIAAHEMAHALGFDKTFFERKQMIATEQIGEAGGAFTVIKSANVMDAVKGQFECENMKYMPLENDGDESIKDRHWDRMYAKDELMSMYLGVSGGFYTKLTLAAFADLGFFQVQFPKAEPMRWGKKACPLLERGKCVNSDITDSNDMFCGTIESSLRCTYDRLALGSCPIKPVSSLDRTDAVSEPEKQMTNRCPVITATPLTSCLDGEEEMMPASLVGPDSRCVRAEGLQLKEPGAKTKTIKAFCAKITCNAQAQSMTIQIKGNANPLLCLRNTRDFFPPSNSIFESGVGKILCPKFEEVCTHLVPQSDTDTTRRVAVPTTYVEPDDARNVQSPTIANPKPGNPKPGVVPPKEKSGEKEKNGKGPNVPIEPLTTQTDNPTNTKPSDNTSETPQVPSKKASSQAPPNTKESEKGINPLNEKEKVVKRNGESETIRNPSINKDGAVQSMALAFTPSVLIALLALWMILT